MTIRYITIFGNFSKFLSQNIKNDREEVSIAQEKVNFEPYKVIDYVSVSDKTDKIFQFPYFQSSEFSRFGDTMPETCKTCDTNALHASDSYSGSSWRHCDSILGPWLLCVR